jgi:hypothetical protein
LQSFRFRRGARIGLLELPSKRWFRFSWRSVLPQVNADIDVEHIADGHVDVIGICGAVADSGLVPHSRVPLVHQGLDDGSGFWAIGIEAQRWFLSGQSYPRGLFGHVSVRAKSAKIFGAPASLMHAVGAATFYAENVLCTGKRISEQARASLALIHVFNEDSQAALLTLGLEKDRPTTEAQQAGQQLTLLESDVGISAATRIARGPVKTALLQAAVEFDALVLGRCFGERTSRTTKRLDVCRSQGLALPGVERVMACTQWYRTLK